MTMTTESSTLASPVPTPEASRRGRVWKVPRPERQLASDRPPRGSYLAVAATLSMIAAGAVAMSHLDDGPTPIAESPAVVELPLGSMYQVVDQVGARSLWDQGITGAGVNVAVIDTGVAAVPELSADGSYELQTARGFGLPLGDYEIAVSARVANPPMPGMPTPPPGSNTFSLIPKKYFRPETSGLRLTVVDGDNPFNIDIKRQ